MEIYKHLPNLNDVQKRRFDIESIVYEKDFNLFKTKLLGRIEDACWEVKLLKNAIDESDNVIGYENDFLCEITKKNKKYVDKYNTILSKIIIFSEPSVQDEISMIFFRYIDKHLSNYDVNMSFNNNEAYLQLVDFYRLYVDFKNLVNNKNMQKAIEKYSKYNVDYEKIKTISEKGIHAFENKIANKIIECQNKAISNYEIGVTDTWLWLPVMTIF